jgi:hypothetical protein
VKITDIDVVLDRWDVPPGPGLGYDIDWELVRANTVAKLS